MTRIIGGTYSSLRLKTPKGSKTRPTQDAFRELVFNLLQGKMEGSSFLDLCAGSGAIGLEALSRGAEKATFVDSSSEAIFAIKQNISFLRVEEQTEILKFEALKALKFFSKKNVKFSHIYIDPPYEAKLGHSTYLADQLLKEIDQLELIDPKGAVLIEDDASKKDPELELKYLHLSKLKIQGKSRLRYYISKRN